MAYLYCTATNTGKGFIKFLDKNRFMVQGHAGDVWVIEDNAHGSDWITRVSGTSKTKEEAQGLVDAAISIDQAAWDSQSAEVKAEKIESNIGLRPETETIP
tara:strand:- start:788 stop:1090 length:303 start_codon:yes stop_codon:yes gene_type:complete